MAGTEATRISSIWNRFIRSILQRPVLFTGMSFYWLWTNMTFQMPVVLGSASFFGITMPSQVALLACNVVTFATVVALFATKRIEPRGVVGVWGPCIGMAVGSALLAVWANMTGSPYGLSIPQVIPSESPRVFPFALGSLFAGAGSALLCIEMQRVYGSLEADIILFHGAASYVASLIIALVLALFPEIVSLAVWTVSPLSVAGCLCKEHHNLTKCVLYHRGEGIRLKLPWKLLVTSLLHGLSLGLLAGLPAYQAQPGTVIWCAGISYLISAALILVTAFAARMNFNSLIYQVAFPIIALGLYATFAAKEAPFIGFAIQLIGFSYLHLVMWCVCSFLINVFDIPTMWVTGTSTCLFMLGQLTGSLSSCIIASGDHEGALVDRLVVSAMLVMLAASLIMFSNSNMRTGWGLARPTKTPSSSQIPLDTAIAQLVSAASLTEREAATLRLLGRGRNRATIASELGVSTETVKTHISGIYRKTHVHSQQELIDLLEERARQIEPDH